MIKTRALQERALAISTNCCLPIGNDPAIVSEGKFSPTLFKCLLASACNSCSFIKPLFPGSRPKKILDAKIEIGCKVEFLVNKCNTQIHGLPHIFKINFFPINRVITGIRRLDTSQDFHQRYFFLHRSLRSGK